MDRDWERVARAFREARKSLGLTQKGLATLAQLNLNTVMNLEGMRQYKRMPPSAKQYAAAVGWPADALERVAAGEAPPAARKVRQGSVDDVVFADGMPLRVQRELKAGTVVDSTVVHLADAKFVGILKVDDPDVDPAQLEEILTAWSDFQRKILDIQQAKSDASDA